MKINKFKALSVAVCCAVTALWTEIQGAEKRNDEPIRHINNYQTELSAGSIVSFAGEVAPHGWLLCDGEQYSNQRYPELYEVVREKYVPGGSWVIEANRRSELEKYFCVPDLRGRVIVGVDGVAGRVTSNNTLGASGGTENVILTIDQMPKHDHKINLASGPNGIHSAMNAIGGVFCDKTVDFSGGDQPHNNMQPYQVLNYIINTGQANNQQKFNIQEQKIEQLEKKINDLEVSQRGCSKAWVVFNGSANILDSYGVSSVIRNEIGEYTINFSHPFNSPNYCSSLNVRGITSTLTAACHHGFPQTTSSFRVITFHFQSGTHTDASVVSACFYGNQ